MRERKVWISWIVIGICMFILPILFYPMVRENLDETNYENRYLAEKPEGLLENYNNYSSQYEDYFNDHLPYRNQFVKWTNLIKCCVFEENVGQVINGKEGWYFYSGDEAINRYKRNSFWDEEYMQNVTDNLVRINKNMEEKGIQFVVLLLPNKEEVYDEYMPSYYPKADGPNQADVLVEYIRKNSDVSVVYPKEEMRSEKGNYQLYFKYDTHYNCLGAFIAYEQLLEVVGKDRTYLCDYIVKKEKMTNRMSGNGDLERMLGFSGEFDNDYEYFLEEYPLISDWTNQRYQNEDSKYSEKVLLVGDSFKISLLPYLCKDFADVRVDDFNVFPVERLNEYQPDIVVLELLERNDKYLGEIVLTD